MQIFVDINASENGNGSQEFPFKYIQQAADIAQPGDYVQVMPGNIMRKFIHNIPALVISRLFMHLLSKIGQSLRALTVLLAGNMLLVRYGN